MKFRISQIFLPLTLILLVQIFTNSLQAGKTDASLHAIHTIARIASSLLFYGDSGTHSQPPTTPQTVDRSMLGVLKKKSAQSMEGISTLTGIGWAQVFMSVERLSRIGKVSLTPVRPCEYRISIGGLLRR